MPRATRCPSSRELRPDVVVADILTLGPSLAAELARHPLRDAHPPRLPRGRARLADLLARRPPSAHRGRPRLLGRARPARRARPAARARRSSTTPARASACPRSSTSTAAPAASSRSSPRFPSSSTHAPGLPTPMSSARSCGSPRPRTSSCLRAMRRSCSSPPRPPRTPTTGMLHAALRGLADAPVRVLATWNRRLPSASAARARQRPRRRLGLLLAHDAPLRCRRLPRRPRHARARALLRLRRRRLPRVGDMNENAARVRLGRGGRARAAAVHLTAAAAPCGGTGARASRRSARARELWPLGLHARRGRPAAELVERLGLRSSGWDSDAPPLGLAPVRARSVELWGWDCPYAPLGDTAPVRGGGI